MRIIRRLAVGFLSIVLAAGLLGGCDNGGDDEGPPVVPQEQQDN